ncbi:MAG: hypothetical protein ACRDKT_11360 [Actinomycetota bacterium]
MGAIRWKKAAAWGAAVFIAFAGLVVVAPPVAADEDRTEHRDIRILTDKDFTEANGVVRGSGTEADPYVISGWSIRNLTIQDTASHVVIRDNEITSRLILDWIGSGVMLVNNSIRDLRVNQNVERTGAATSGYIGNNKFGIVGQLRHFDGIFENNVVRPSPGMFDAVFGEARAVNFDGFNGARFRNNTIYGYMDVRLHGHHHGSSFGDQSHYHGTAHDHGSHGAHGGTDVDHSKRYHQVWVSNNKIYSTSHYALQYTDSAHSANDRTAASERNEELNKPHVHYTRVHLTNNKLIGSGLSVDIFNADDRNHTKTERGALEITGNHITVHDRDETFSASPNGIEIWNAKDVELTIARNVITGVNKESLPSHEWLEGEPAGIWMHDLDLANVFVTANRVVDLPIGIRASQFTETVEWWISRLATEGVEEAVVYDESVENEPHRRP